jgi:hypothetical protein
MAKKDINYTLDTQNIWFPDQVEPLIEDKAKFRNYWKREKDRIINGFWIADNQVYVPGWLYWHTVYWIIELDIETVNAVTGEKRSYKGKGVPRFRDLEWDIAHDLKECERQQKMYVLVGSRGFGKSNICASVTGYTYNFFDDSESVISGGFDNDINLLAQKIDLGLSNCHPVWFKRRLLNNWKKEVRAGWIDTDTNLRRGSNSRIISRNYEEGNNTMATNGTRPKVHIIDEIGKIPNLENCVLDSQPCWMNDYGMFSTPILAGTGGDMEVGEDAAKLFRFPETYHVLEFDDIWEGSGKIGKFIPATQARNEFKEDMTLFKYLTEVRKMDIIYHPDLDITIKVSNEERCMKEYVEPRREKALKSTTNNAIIKEKAYYPIKPSESFLTVSSNDFPIEDCEKHKKWLHTEGFEPLRIELYIDDQGRINHKMTEKLPVTDFPVLSSTLKEGCIQMIEPPVSNPPYGLYVAGIDPYKTGESDWSDSLGSIYVLKRMTADMNDPYQYMPVCWYTGRPKDIHEWYETVRRIIKWYNASAMCENADYGFIQYMISKNEEQYLAKGLSFLKEISPNTKHKGQIGLPPTVAMIDHWNKTLVRYATEEVAKERDDNGNVTNTILGVKRIMDSMLLEEMIKFNKNKGNFDRVRAFQIAVAYAQQLDAIMPTVTVDTGHVEKKRSLPKSPFLGTIGGTFGKSKSPFNVRL